MKRPIRSIFIAILILVYHTATAQHQEIAEQPATWKEKKDTEPINSRSLLQAFRTGHVSGHFRYFLMATDNENKLTDYVANALGGGLKFETTRFHNFQFGVSGFYIFNIGSSDLTKPDSTTKLFNRYETALFDIEDPTNKSNIDRLEELYLKYHFKKTDITIGKQLINTPFINLQDGRMRPTEVEGVWMNMNEIKKTNIEAGYLYRLSPRSTSAYYPVAESIGIYPSGVNTDGSKSDYKNNLTSNGIFSIGIKNQSVKNLTLQVWNLYVDQIFNSSLLQVDYKHTLSDRATLVAGLQSIYQTALQYGGNADQTKTYIENNSHSFTYGARLGLSRSNLEASINYNRITAAGRYLMPREWGRDPFYTFMPRERNEGLGDVHATTLKVNYSLLKNRLKTNGAVGYYKLPLVTEYRLNKYGMPTYVQANLDVRYEFAGSLRGFDAQLLLVRKINISDESLTDKQKFNKVNMTNLSFILNFHF